MLKALELHGFKSFADRARFEFPAGITVIVGPNGSGKSNIVDCLKWVLGEQSAKSLRGKEMSDVIFKGSGQGGRRPMNTAEATLVFDNSEKQLPIDAPEVHITRRVYRSGEGEYLINRQPARLKDIRDLCRGTGVGVDAYSLIEQGKVDKLLQASAKDRRAIFEEAAGISRFKAKKVESQRRLERVEQNMLRLADIVEEVENRLKTVRSQAGKAKRYREYSERLQQLRTQIALVDWRKLTAQLDAIQADLAAARDATAAADAQGQRLEAQQLELEAAATSAGEELRNCENQLAAARHECASSQGTIEHERLRLVELDEERVSLGRNLLAMTDKAGDLRSKIAAAEESLAVAERERQTAAAQLEKHDRAIRNQTDEIAACRLQADTRRQKHVAHLQEAATFASQAESSRQRLTLATEAVERHQDKIATLAAQVSQCQGNLQTLASERERVAAELAQHAEQVETADEELAECRNLYGTRAEDLAQLHARHAGVSKRSEVLDELERTLEGIGQGVKELLLRAGKLPLGDITGEHITGEHDTAQATPTHPWSLVKGVLASLVKVEVDFATAVDVALGEFTQSVVVAGSHAELEALVREAEDLAGRVALATLNPTESPAVELNADAVAGVQVLARADKLVECEPEFRPLIERLLGRTFVVRTLADAFTLSPRAPSGTRVVTLGGELLDEFGVCTFGPRQSATSLISRKSQLRASRLELAVLEQQIGDSVRETAHLKREIERWETRLRELNEAGKALSLAEHTAQARLDSAQQEIDQLQRLRAEAQSSRDSASQACGIETTQLENLKQALASAQAQADDHQQWLHQQDERLAQLEAARQQLSAQLLAARVELVRCEQRVEGLRQELARLADDSRDRSRIIEELRLQLAQCQTRREVSAVHALNAAAAINAAMIRAEAFQQRLKDTRRRRDVATRDRAKLGEELAAVRRRGIELREEEHKLALSTEQVRHSREALAARLREDYQIELAELTHEPSPEEAEQRTAVEEEIESLRRKINQIGAVNLDALEELDDLEERFGRLSAQYNDLTEAKASLERIIHKINADSRRLFLETLEAIRLNFQALYRKAFGGGKADLVLEEGVDVLECGVEIVATPPGKPSFNNSLLSGGEKALTAVALLLAIFQFRPSPFCILDEVDAPFDEANIGRFVDVLKEFLGWTRFVIVTHSKKTMTAATTLYGITMQESGVSKRVSVRFDDVTDDGHIRREALDRGRLEATDDAA